MKLLVVNTPRGLVPMGDDDYDEKKKLKLGETYSVEVKVVRNLDFHRKYFALISYAWEFLNEQETAAFRTKDGFRKSVEIAAGHYEPQYDLTTRSYIHAPKSISFGKMDNAAFSDLYRRVKDVIFSIIGDRVNEDEFEHLILDF
jgi:hypothetical protein